MSGAQEGTLRHLWLRKSPAQELLDTRGVSRESAAASSLSSALLQAAPVSRGGTLRGWMDLWPHPAGTALRVAFQRHKILMYVRYKRSFETVVVSHT